MFDLNNYKGVLTFDELNKKVAPIEIEINLAINFNVGDKVSIEFLNMFKEVVIETDTIYEVIDRYLHDDALHIEI